MTSVIDNNNSRVTVSAQDTINMFNHTPNRTDKTQFSDVSSNQRVKSYASIHQSRNGKANLSKNCSKSLNSGSNSSPQTKKTSQTTKTVRDRSQGDKVMAKDIVDVLGMKKNSTKAQILNEVRNFKKLAAEADMQKREIEDLRSLMNLSDHNSLLKDTNVSKLPPKLQVNDHIFSEKPNYTTAKFFDQVSD